MTYAKITFILDGNTVDAVGEHWFSSASTDMPSVSGSRQRVPGLIPAAATRAAVIALTRRSRRKTF